MANTHAEGPLAGLRVLDFTQNLPGPYATQLLAGMGAEVIKVEPPRGDTARATGRFFDLVNAGKSSVALDLKDPAERARLDPLLATIDVLVEGFRPGVMDELGFGAASVRAKHPRLVYCSISAYGQEGPYRARPGHDLNLQALVGAADLGRDAHERPRGGALPVADLSAAMTATIAILGALTAREKHGQGATLDVALTDAIHSWTYLWGEGLTPTELPLGEALPSLSRQVSKRAKNAFGDAVARFLDEPGTRTLANALGARLRASDFFRQFERTRLHTLPHYGTFRCKDGAYLAIGIVDEDKFWAALCDAVGLAGLRGIPLPGRFLLAPTLRPLVAAAIARRTRAAWLHALDLDAIPASPVLRFDEALDDPQLRKRRPPGETPVVPPPLAHVRGQRAPKLGEHGARWLGR